MAADLDRCPLELLKYGTVSLKHCFSQISLASLPERRGRLTMQPVGLLQMVSYLVAAGGPAG